MPEFLGKVLRIILISENDSHYKVQKYVFISDRLIRMLIVIPVIYELAVITILSFKCQFEWLTDLAICLMSLIITEVMDWVELRIYSRP